MTKDGAGSPSNNGPDQVDPWVRSQLSAYHVLWLEKQGDVVNKAELLKYALAEWVVRHPNDCFKLTNVCNAIRSALDEFIARQK
jgi:DNA-binding winged helix-turn-helix (wHTH) protein